MLETFHAATRTPDTYVTSGRYAGHTVVRTELFPDLALELAKIWE